MPELKVSEMDSPPSLTRKSVVLSIVLEEVTDHEEEEDVVDGIENIVADDAHDGLALSAFKRQETFEELEQGRGTCFWNLDVLQFRK